MMIKEDIQISTAMANLISSYDEKKLGNSEVDVILSNLNKSIVKIINEILSLKEKADDQITLYGPYLGRSLLELTITALLTKIDPFRILVVKGKQTHPTFDVTKPQKSSIRWQGDVMTEAIPNIWDDKHLQNPTRALFGAYQTELVLKKSAVTMLDSVTEDNIGDWYDRITSFDANQLIEFMKSQISSLYSSLSKGIHHEFVVPPESVLDRDTVLSRLSDVIFNTSTLALVVSFIPHIYEFNNIETTMQLFKSTSSIEVQ